MTIYSRLKGRGTCLFERKSDTQDYAIIAFDPVRRLTFQKGEFQNGEDSYPCTDPLKELGKYVLKEELEQSDLLFQGGALGYVGYDVAACYETIGEIMTSRKLAAPWLSEILTVKMRKSNWIDEWQI